MCMACIWLINAQRNENEKRREKENKNEDIQRDCKTTITHIFLFISSVHCLIFEHVSK
jgi:hypothetical protein